MRKARAAFKVSRSSYHIDKRRCNHAGRVPCNKQWVIKDKHQRGDLTSARESTCIGPWHIDLAFDAFRENSPGGVPYPAGFQDGPVEK